MVKKALRTSKRSKKSSVEQVHSPGKDWLVPQPEDDESSPGENSFIYSPSRRRTRGEPSISLFIFIYFSVNGCNPLLCLCQPKEQIPLNNVRRPSLAAESKCRQELQLCSHLISFSILKITNLFFLFAFVYCVFIYLSRHSYSISYEPLNQDVGRSTHKSLNHCSTEAR